MYFGCYPTPKCLGLSTGGMGLLSLAPTHRKALCETLLAFLLFPCIIHAFGRTAALLRIAVGKERCPHAYIVFESACI